MITFDNYFLNTEVTFKGCKKPKRKPDYISHDKYGNTSSVYWYGENKKGKYVIRCSDHWLTYKAFDHNKKKKQCKSIASCMWRLKTTKILPESCGKAYLTDFIRINQ